MFALQVWQPSTYQSVNDADQLLTVFLAYIPSDKVDTLAQQITDKNSQFYTGAGPPYTDLALHVNAAFPVQAVTSPTTGMMVWSLEAPGKRYVAASPAGRTMVPGLVPGAIAAWRRAATILFCGSVKQLHWQ